MAKVLKEESALLLDAAVKELAGLHQRLGKAQRSEVELKAELEAVWNERLVKGVDGQKRSIELRSLIFDEQGLSAALAKRIEEKQEQVKKLEWEKIRDEANTLCLAAEAEFYPLVKALDIAPLEAWLVRMTEAHKRYMAANRSSNMKMERLTVAMTDLVSRIKVVQTL